MTQDVDQRVLDLFEIWYEQEMPRIFNYISYRVRDQGVAEEITASVCEQALVRLHQYDPLRGEIKAWMFGIARNALNGYLRSLQRRPTLVSIDSLPELHVKSPSVERSFELKEDFKKAMAAVATLPERDQEIIAMRYGGGLTNQEIAHITGKSDNHVAVLLYRAMKKLRQHLTDEDDTMNQQVVEEVCHE